MVEITWEEPPEAAVLRTRGAGGKYIELAIALRDHPGRWALLPSDSERTPKGAAATAQNIRRGKVKGFDKGLYESAHAGSKVWVRFLPPADAPAAQDDTRGDPRDDASSTRPAPADVRAWAVKQGLAVTERGRLPEDVVAKYNAALERGEVGLPLRVLPSGGGAG